MDTYTFDFAGSVYCICCYCHFICIICTVNSEMIANSRLLPSFDGGYCSRTVCK